MVIEQAGYSVVLGISEVEPLATRIAAKILNKGRSAALNGHDRARNSTGDCRISCSEVSFSEGRGKSDTKPVVCVVPKEVRVILLQQAARADKQHGAHSPARDWRGAISKAPDGSSL